jgi:hypothetical protein
MSGKVGGNIINSGLVLCLDAANKNSYTSGSSSWRDLSGNNNNGTLTNGPIYSNNNNGIIVFDGVDDYISINDSTSLQLTSTLTLSIWVYITAAFNGRGLITKGPASSDYDYMMYLTTNSTNIQFYKKNSSGTVSFVGTSPRTYINKWKNIVITFDGVNVVQYDNSIPFLNTTFANSEIRTSSNSLRILSGWSGYTSGNLSMVQIYNRALSQLEVQQNFNATRTRFGL